MHAKTNAIKWLGILTMTLDHVGHILFPSVVWLRIIGRIAFPFFLYTTIQGTLHTRDHKRYIRNLLITGVLSQVLTGTTPNILFQLALFSLSLRYKKAFPVFFTLSFFVEYGGYGLLMGWSISLLTQKKTALGLGLFFLLHLLPGTGLQVFAGLFLPFFFMKQVPALAASTEGIRLPLLSRAHGSAEGLGPAFLSRCPRYRQSDSYFRHFPHTIPIFTNRRRKLYVEYQKTKERLYVD